MDGNSNGRVLQTQRAGLRIGRTFSRAVGLACLLTAGCISTTSANPEGTSLSATTVPKDLIATATSDAARRASVSRDAVEVVSAAPVTWPDGALGCPQPGMTYTQALVPGYRIVLRAGGKEFNYHVGGRGGPMFCPPERVTAPVPGAADDRI
jgi:hypothetical protein